MSSDFTGDGYVFYVNVTPGNITQDQIDSLRKVEENVLRVLGKLSQRAIEAFEQSPEAQTLTQSDDRNFAIARQLERVYNKSGEHLSIIGRDTQNASLKIKNKDFHAEIILLAAQGISGLPSSEGFLMEAESVMQLVMESFKMGGSQSIRRRRCIVATIYSWNSMTLRFDVRTRMICFDITAQMEEIITQRQGKKNAPTTTEGKTTLEMVFETMDWRFIPTRNPSKMATEPPPAYPELRIHRIEYTAPE